MKEREFLVAADRSLGKARLSLYELGERNEELAEKMDAPLAKGTELLGRRIRALDRLKLRGKLPPNS